MLVGRELELGILNAHLEKMLAGNGSVLFLTGEAGLGKTTLVHSWYESLLSKPLLLESACSIPIGNVDVGRLEALQPWADVIAQLGGHRDRPDLSERSHPSDLPAGKMLNLKQLMHDSAPAWAWALPVVGDFAHAAVETVRAIKEQREEAGRVNMKKLAQDTAASWAMAVPVVGGVAHAAMETARLMKEQREKPAAPTATNQQQVFQQYVNMLTKVAEEQPLVIFLDDLHWADASSCNLLFYLARRISEKRILVIGTYRREDVAAANNGKGHPIVSVRNEILRYNTGKEVTLGYLDRQAIAAIMLAMFPEYRGKQGKQLEEADRTDPTFESWLLRISDGNALFVTQFLKTLREDGHLNNAGQFSGEYDTIAIPQSALAVVDERVRRLDDDTRDVLMNATAEGEEFTSYMVEQLTERKPTALLKSLQGAARQGLIVERGKSRLFANRTTALFGFSHALFHKALYDQLLDAQKEHLHRQCFELLKAEWDTADAARQTTLASKLVMHAEKCEEWQAVADIAYAAGKQAWDNRFSREETMAMAAKVLHAADHAGDALLHRRADALLLRGLAEKYAWQIDASNADMQAARELFLRVGDQHGAVHAHCLLAGNLWQTRAFDRALEEGTRAVQEAQAADDGLMEALGRNILGLVLRDRGRFEESLAHFERSMEIRRQLGNLEGEAASLINIGTVHYAQGHFALDVEYTRRGLELARAAGHKLWEKNALANLANALSDLGELDEAEELTHAEIDLVKQLGDKSGECGSLNSLGTLAQRKGDHAQGAHYYEQTLAVAREIGERAAEAGALNNLAGALIELGRVDEAIDNCRSAIDIAHSIDHVTWEASGLGVLAHAYHTKRRDDEALVYCDQGIGVLAAQSLSHLELPLRLKAAEYCTALARFGEARARIESAEAIARELDATEALAKAFCLRGEVFAAEAVRAAEPERTTLRLQAVDWLQRGIDSFAACGRPRDAEKWRGELGRMQ